jgi:hypothetical protein
MFIGETEITTQYKHESGNLQNSSDRDKSL